MFNLKWVFLICAVCLAVLVGGHQSTTAFAVQTAEQMSCEQAKSYYETHGYIYKLVHGRVMRIQKGTSIRRAGAVQCTGRKRWQQTYSVQTRDKRRCTISTYCTG